MIRTDTCPECGQGNVEGDSVDVDAHGAEQECHCLDCGAVWYLKFKAVEKLLIDAELEPEDDAEVDALLKSAEDTKSGASRDGVNTDDGTVTGGGYY